MDWKILNLDDKNTYPDSSQRENIVFYIKEDNKLYIGHYDGEKFVATHPVVDNYSFKCNVLKKLEPHLVSCYLELDSVQKNQFKSVTVESLSDDGVYICNHKIGPHSGFMTVDTKESIVESSYNMDTMIACKVPQLPVEIGTNSMTIGKFKWAIVDMRDGWYTYNFFRKRLWWWFHYGDAILTNSLVDGYNEAVATLRKYANQ